MNKRISWKLFAVITIIFWGALIYSNSLNGSFHLDDESSIVNNGNIRALPDLRAIWDFWPTRFVTYFSVALNYHFHQLEVFGYHLVNLLIHLFSSLLVFWLCLLTFRTPVMKDKNISKRKDAIAFFAAAVFLTHPLQTQAVNYIIQRATLLAAFFSLTSLCLYVKARLKQNSKWKIFYLGSILAAAISMFTKEMALSLPFLVCLYEFCFLSAGNKFRWKYIIPFLAIILVIPLTMLITGSVNIKEMRRAAEPSAGISVGDYFLTQLRVMVTYLRLVLFPLNQNLDYDYPLARSLFSLPVLSSLSLLVLVLGSTVRLFNKFRLTSFGVFLFFIALLPESSLIPIKDVIFEHRLYLPMAGFSLFLVSALHYLFQNKTVKFMVIMLSLLVAGYSLLTYQRNKVWKDEISLWSDCVRKSPHKARPYNNRGLSLVEQGDSVFFIQSTFQQALADYDRALDLDPYYSDAYYNRGNLFLTIRSFKQAITDYDKAIELNPGDSEAYFNRAQAYSALKEFDKSRQDQQRAKELGKQ